MKIICKKVLTVESIVDAENLIVEIEDPLNYEDIINDLCIQFGTNTIRKCLED